MLTAGFSLFILHILSEYCPGAKVLLFNEPYQFLLVLLNRADSFPLKSICMYQYDTISQAVTGLRERGYTVDFNLGENCLVCHGDQYNINDFEITEVHRFEGDTDPSDEAVVYAIESKVKGTRGILVSGYGISAEGMSMEMILKLSIHLGK